MIASRKRQMGLLVLWTIGWSLALIASAVLFKGNPLKDWIQAILFVGAATFYLWLYQRMSRHSC